MKASSMRTAVRRQLVALIAAQLGDEVPVTRGFPGEGLKADQIYITGTRGAMTNDVFAGRALPTDDRFIVSFLCVATVGGRNIDEAETVAERFANAVMNAAHDTTLDDFTVNSSYVIQAVPADWSDYSAQAPDGNAAFSNVDVAVHTRTSYTGADAQ